MMHAFFHLFTMVSLTLIVSVVLIHHAGVLLRLGKSFFPIKSYVDPNRMFFFIFLVLIGIECGPIVQVDHQYFLEDSSRFIFCCSLWLHWYQSIESFMNQKNRQQWLFTCSFGFRSWFFLLFNFCLRLRFRHRTCCFLRVFVS